MLGVRVQQSSVWGCRLQLRGAPAVRQRQTVVSVASRHTEPISERQSSCHDASTSERVSPEEEDSFGGPHLAALLVGLFAAGGLPAMAADEAVAYNNSGQSEAITNVAGFFYIILVCYFFYKVFTKRAKSFTTERIGGDKGASDKEGSDAEADALPKLFDDPELEQPKQVTVWDSFIGAVQAAVIGYFLWIFSTKVDAAMDATILPDQYTARNISITVKTIIRGISYLATFVFAANALGLTALTLKLILFGDDEFEAPAPKAAPRGPSIRLDSSLEDVMAAFDDASQPSPEARSRPAQRSDRDNTRP